MAERIELPNQDKIRTLREIETYKRLGILEADIIKHAEIKEKIEKEYLRRTRNRKIIGTFVCLFCLVGFYGGISTFLDYLMPNLFLYK